MQLVSLIDRCVEEFNHTYSCVELGQFVVVQHLARVGDVGGHGVSFLQGLLPGLRVHPVNLGQSLAELLSVEIEYIFLILSLIILYSLPRQ